MSELLKALEEEIIALKNKIAELQNALKEQDLTILDLEEKLKKQRLG